MNRIILSELSVNEDLVEAAMRYVASMDSDYGPLIDSLFANWTTSFPYETIAGLAEENRFHYEDEDTNRFMIEVEEKAKSDLEREANRVKEGEQTPEEWDINVTTTTTLVAYLAVVSAYEGHQNVSKNGWARLSQQVRDNRLSMERIIRGYRSTVHPVTNAFRDSVNVLTNTYQFFARARRGFALETEVVNEEKTIAESGACDDCQARAGLGWSSLGSLTPPGATQCRSNCRCTWVFRHNPNV